MRKFRFPLAKLERLRSHMERLAQRSLAEALASVNILRNQMKVVYQNIEACEAELESAPALGIALIDGFNVIRTRLDREIEQADQRVEVARTAYHKRRRDAKSLRRLKEDKHAAWKAESMKEEQAELEEMARSGRHQREQSEAME